MGRMATLNYDKAINVRTTAAARGALNIVIAQLRASERLKFNDGGLATKEAIVNAMWLAIADVHTDRLAGWLAPYLAKLDEDVRPASLVGSVDPDDWMMIAGGPEPEPSPPAQPQSKKKPSARKAAESGEVQPAKPMRFVGPQADTSEGLVREMKGPQPTKRVEAKDQVPKRK